MNTPITFKGYQINSINYLQNEEHLDENFEPSFEPDFECSVDEEETKGMVEVISKIKTHQIILEVSVTGFFDLNREYSEDISELKRSLIVNGGAIILPYVRSISSIITALDSNQAVILPTVNVMELLRNKSE
ncbi:hypothetical protein AB6889_12110 [Carnobacterium maltaromaticum]|uniref:hypothetical protein n=1 Tax=Carnobacterium TaxID=2747 RepID=UPI0030FB2E12